jgi:hypothetical protein
MTWNLFLDDERYPAEESDRFWHIARNHEDVVNLVEKLGFPSYVSFDHDLGDFIPNGDGYQVAKYLCDLDMYTEYKMPDNFDFYVHSQNPVGKANIEGYLRAYLRAREVPVDGDRIDELWEAAKRDDGTGNITVGKLE